MTYNNLNIVNSGEALKIKRKIIESSSLPFIVYPVLSIEFVPGIFYLAIFHDSL